MEQGITKEDLQQFGLLLIGRIRKLLEADKNQGRDALRPEWLKSRAVRKLLDMSPGSLQNLRITGKIRFKKVLGSYYYNKEDLLRCLTKTMAVMETNEFIHYLAVFEKDNRLSSWHIAILAAVLTLALRQGRVRSIKASRSKIMTLSHINTFPTYHKYFKGLQEIGYIRYRPSYHPGLRSEIDLIKQPFD